MSELKFRAKNPQPPTTPECPALNTDTTTYPIVLSRSPPDQTLSGAANLPNRGLISDDLPQSLLKSESHGKSLKAMQGQWL